MATVAAIGVVSLAGIGAQSPPPWLPLDAVAQAAASADRESNAALARIGKQWRTGYASMLLDLAELSRAAVTTAGAVDQVPIAPLLDGQTQDPGSADRASRAIDRTEVPAPRPVSPVRERILRFLEQQTGQRFGRDFERWHRWIWSLPYDPHPEYVRFKGLLYSNIDPRMERFFPAGAASLIRLDEIEWGGVAVNGIPPLYYPKHVAAQEARYLKDDHVVFGMVFNGEARAYPKRILAWHELAWDRVGGIELTIVYCTLCGTVIPYESQVGGVLRRFGTSGLLYRSNKLMFDEQTGSLWSTLEGKPVVGTLAGKGLELRPRPIVTTTWAEWRRRHPATTVLSLDTGHERDYSEGAAYRDYFATDRLMFGVPVADRRLKNKDEVLVLRLPAVTPGAAPTPVAIAVDLLNRQPIFHARAGVRSFVVITTRGGANRAYDSGDRRFGAGGGSDRLTDDRGRIWTITEDALVADGERAPRLAAQRAFWFGWHAQFPETVLIK